MLSFLYSDVYAAGRHTVCLGRGDEIIGFNVGFDVVLAVRVLTREGLLLLLLLLVAAQVEAQAAHVGLHADVAERLLKLARVALEHVERVAVVGGDVDAGLAIGGHADLHFDAAEIGGMKVDFNVVVLWRTCYAF